MEEAVKKETIELSYPKAPFGKRFIAFLIDFSLMAFFTLGFFVLFRLAVENSSSYQNAFKTYVSISEKSGLYVYKETNDNLVKASEYYKDQYKEDYIGLDSKLESVFLNFYKNDPIVIFNGEGESIYSKQKIGESSIKDSSGASYWKDDGLGNIVYAQSEENMYSFYKEANVKAIEYLSRSEDYVNASKTLSKTINFFLIPASIAISFTIFEFLVPLIFFRRGWQSIGMKLMKLSLLGADGLSPKFLRFLARFGIFLLVEILISMVTFGVPIFVSFSMFAFRKDGQNFHDYMTGTYVVDSSENSIYVSKEEYVEMQTKAKTFEPKVYR